MAGGTGVQSEKAFSLSKQTLCLAYTGRCWPKKLQFNFQHQIKINSKMFVCVLPIFVSSVCLASNSIQVGDAQERSTDD